MNQDEKYLVTTGEFALLLKVESAYINRLGRDVFPEAKVTRGAWDLRIALPLWRQSKARGEDDTVNNDIDLRLERALLYQQQRRKLEYENALTEQSLLDAGIVEQYLQELQATYNSLLEALEGRLVGELVSVTGNSADKIINVIQPELNNNRLALAKSFEALANQFALGSHGGAAPADSSVAMG